MVCVPCSNDQIPEITGVPTIKVMITIGGCKSARRVHSVKLRVPLYLQGHEHCMSARSETPVLGYRLASHGGPQGAPARNVIRARET